MRTKTPLTAVRLTIFAGVLLWSLASLADSSRVQFPRDTSTDAPQTSDAAQRDYTPKYLADRLGVAERSTKLIGLPVRDQSGHKLGKLQDLTMDLSTGRILCVLVASGDAAGTVPMPAKCFRAPETSGAIADLDKKVFSDAPHSAVNADQTALFNSLRQSYAFFNQKIVWDESVIPTQLVKASELVGFSLRNQAGEPLGKVVNLIADLPTARVVFAVVSFKGGSDDLFVVPPAALHLVPAEHALLLNADKAKVASLAHSDGFFWSSLADPAAGAAAYQTFGQTADFDVAASPAADPTKEEVRAKVETTPATQKADPEIEHDLLTALMHDDVNNAITFKNVRMLTVNGQVTLSGHVKNDKQKSKLIAIATGVVGAASVHDQIEVK